MVLEILFSERKLIRPEFLQKRIAGNDGIEITIDEWPFLEPFFEIEGAS